MADQDHLVHRAEEAIVKDAKQAAQVRKNKISDAVRSAEKVELDAAKSEARKKLPKNTRLSHPYPKAEVNEELTMLKTLASGGDLSHDEIHVLAGMSIRHHETTKRHKSLPQMHNHIYNHVTKCQAFERTRRSSR